MKTKFLFSLLAVFLVVTMTIQAQSAFTSGYNPKRYALTEDGVTRGVVFEIKGEINKDGTDIDTLYTQPFQLWNYDDLPYTYPIKGSVVLSGGTQGTRRLSAYLLGCNTIGGTYTVIDTVSNIDSVSTELRKVLNFNGYQRAYYKLMVFKGNATNNICAFNITLYAYRRD